MGWNATQVTGDRCDCKVCRAGERGSHEAGSMLRRDNEVGVAESSSDCRFAFRDSKSMIYADSSFSVDLFYLVSDIVSPFSVI